MKGGTDMTVCNEKYKELIALYSTGALTSEEEDVVKKHIKECDECKEEFEIYQAIEHELDLSMYQAPKTLHDDVMKRLPHKNETRVVRYQPYFSVAAAVVFVVLLGVVGLMNPNIRQTASDETAIEYDMATGSVNEDNTQMKDSALEEENNEVEAFSAESSMSIAQDEAVTEEAAADDSIDAGNTQESIETNVIVEEQIIEDTPQATPRMAMEAVENDVDEQADDNYQIVFILAAIILTGIGGVLIYRRAKKR